MFNGAINLLKSISYNIGLSNKIYYFCDNTIKLTKDNDKMTNGCRTYSLLEHVKPISYKEDYIPEHFIVTSIKDSARCVKDLYKKVMDIPVVNTTMKYVKKGLNIYSHMDLLASAVTWKQGYISSRRLTLSAANLGLSYLSSYVPSAQFSQYHHIETPLRVSICGLLLLSTYLTLKDSDRNPLMLMYEHMVRPALVRVGALNAVQVPEVGIHN